MSLLDGYSIYVREWSFIGSRLCGMYLCIEYKMEGRPSGLLSPTGVRGARVYELLLRSFRLLLLRYSTFSIGRYLKKNEHPVSSFH